MSAHKPDQSKSKVEFKVKTGEECTLQYELPILILDDPFLGLLKSVNVKFTYKDGFKTDAITDDSGMVRMAFGHGNYVDAEISTVFGRYTRRIFVLPAEIGSPDGVWQRLINLGYVSMANPPESPTTPEMLEVALEEFQADHDLSPDGKINGEVVRVLKMTHDEDRDSWSSRGSDELPPEGPFPDDDNPKEKIT
jgi:hypothetical protein